MTGQTAICQRARQLPFVAYRLVLAPNRFFGDWEWQHGEKTAVAVYQVYRIGLVDLEATSKAGCAK